MIYMKPGETSKTAEYNALYRGIETYCHSPKKRLFTDLLAPSFLGSKAMKYLNLPDSH